MYFGFKTWITFVLWLLFAVCIVVGPIFLGLGLSEYTTCKWCRDKLGTNLTNLSLNQTLDHKEKSCLASRNAFLTWHPENATASNAQSKYFDWCFGGSVLDSIIAGGVVTGVALLLPISFFFMQPPPAAANEDHRNHSKLTPDPPAHHSLDTPHDGLYPHQKLSSPRAWDSKPGVPSSLSHAQAPLPGYQHALGNPLWSSSASPSPPTFLTAMSSGPIPVISSAPPAQLEGIHSFPQGQRQGQGLPSSPIQKGGNDGRGPRIMYLGGRLLNEGMTDPFVGLGQAVRVSPSLMVGSTTPMHPGLSSAGLKNQTAMGSAHSGLYPSADHPGMLHVGQGKFPPGISPEAQPAGQGRQVQDINPEGSLGKWRLPWGSGKGQNGQPPNLEPASEGTGRWRMPWGRAQGQDAPPAVPEQASEGMSKWRMPWGRAQGQETQPVNPQQASEGEGDNGKWKLPWGKGS